MEQKTVILYPKATLKEQDALIANEFKGEPCPYALLPRIKEGCYNCAAINYCHGIRRWQSN